MSSGSQGRLLLFMNFAKFQGKARNGTQLPKKQTQLPATWTAGTSPIRSKKFQKFTIKK